MSNIKITEKDLENLAEIKVASAFTELQKEQILYYEILKRINFVISPEFTKAIGGIGYDPKTDKIYYFMNQDAVLRGSKYVEKDNVLVPEHTKSSIKDMAGLTQHECSHLLLDHIFYFDKEKDNDLFNRAKDYVINDTGSFLSERYDEIKNPKNNSILEGGCFFRELANVIPELKGKTAHDYTSLELYEILKQNQDKLPKNPKPNFDEHNISKVSVDENGDIKIEEGDVSLTEEQKSQISEEVKKVLRQSMKELKDKGMLDKAIGQLSGEISNKIQEMIASVTDKKAVYQFAHSLKNGRKTTIRRVNKRYPYLAKGRKSDKKPILVRVIDSSGSMNNPELRMMIADQVYQLINICKQLYIVVGDTVLQFSAHIESESDFNVDTIDFKGGGGTDLQFGWDFAESVEADGVICDTDGYIDGFDDKGIPSMFYLYGEVIKEVEGYENYKVFPEAK